MSKEKLSKKEFDLLFPLIIKQPWLKNKEAELNYLFSEYPKDSHKQLLSKLLHKFEYINPEKYANCLDMITRKIINHSGFDENSTIISSLTVDDSSDSSQKIIYDIDTIIRLAGWRNVKSVNNFNKVGNTKNKQFNQIILIDEFLGSGKTVEARIKKLNELFGENQYQLLVCMVAGIHKSKNRLINGNIDIFIAMELEKAFEDSNLDEFELVESYLNMNEIESHLKSTINNKRIIDYRFGYGNAQALFYKEGNAVNSVFPVFWWEYDKKENKRLTLLNRYEDGL